MDVSDFALDLFGVPKIAVIASSPLPETITIFPIGLKILHTL